MSKLENKEIVSLYCGIGAIEEAGKNQSIQHDIVAACDYHDHVEKVYKILNPQAENKYIHDVTTIKKGDIKRGVGLLSHGSPCQDFSINGKEEGGDKGSETRSSLMHVSVDIIEDVMPEIVVWENVLNSISSKHVHNVNAYIESLSKLGYISSMEVLNSDDYNIPQGRKRVFIVSQLNGEKFVFPEKIKRTVKLKDLCRFREKDDITFNFERYCYENKDTYGLTKCDHVNASFETKKGDENIIDFNEFIKNLKPGRTNVINMNMYKYDQLNRITIIDDSLKTKSPTLSCRGAQNYTIKYLHEGKIYKPSPLMCALLMGFSEETFNKIKDSGTDSELIDRFGNSIVVTVWEAILKKIYK